MISVLQVVPLVFACVVAPLASAANYYVTPAGNDTHNGLSPQSAFRATPAGKNTIHVAPGECEETESSILPPRVSLSGAEIGKTIFHWKAVRSLAEKPMKFDFSGFMIQMEDFSDASISGLIIIGSLPDDQRAHGSILARELRHDSIHNCEVNGLEFTGIWLSQATNSNIHQPPFSPPPVRPPALSTAFTLKANS